MKVELSLTSISRIHLGKSILKNEGLVSVTQATLYLKNEQ